MIDLNVDSLLQRQFDSAVGFIRKGEYEYSIQSFENAVATIKSDEEIKNTNLVYRTYVNFGVILKRIGERKRALEFYNIAEKFTIEEFGEGSEKLTPIYVNIGNIYSEYRELNKAQTYYEKALSSVGDSKKSRWTNQITHNLGAIYYKKGNYSEALKFYLEALELKTKSRSENISSSLANIGNCYKQLEKFEEADMYYQRSIKEYIKMYGNDYFQLAHSYMNYAVFQEKLNKTDKVLPYLNLAYSIYKKNFGEKHPDVAFCLQNFGDFYDKKGNHLNALQYYQKALIAELDNFNNNTVYVNPSMEEIDPQLPLVEILKAKALTFYKLYDKTKSIGDLDYSISTYDLCFDIIDKIRIAYQDEESKFALSQNEKATYNEAIEVAVKLYQLTKDEKYKKMAFRYSERSKSASLSSSLNDVNAKKFGGIPIELQDQERNLKLDISNYRELVYEERRIAKPNRDSITKWQNILFDYNEQYNQMVLQFEEDYPEYYNLKYNTDVIEVEALQEAIDNKDVLIEYSISDSTLYTFVITKNDFEIRSKKIVKDSFDFQIEEVRNCLKTNDFTSNSTDYYKRYTKSAHGLYQYLLKEIEDSIVGKNLLIVPDDKMAYVPFGVLLKNEADSSSMNYRILDYLIKSNTITYHNSATLGFKDKSNNNYSFSSSKSILAFAPSYKDVDDSILYTERAYRDKLYPLPGAKEEVNNISKVIDGDLYVDDIATESNFKKNASKYDVLHLAMHTIIDDENPMFSKLVFTQNQDSTQDGLLNTHEIYNMEFNARMVVLSACNTGDGKLLKGEGVMSLARGFFYAGCPSIIMTLWTVEDKTGSNLMSNFYDFLAQGLNKDVALREAKLKYLESADALKSHPYFWSGYVTMGDVDPLYDNKFRNLLLIAALSVLGVLSLIIIRRRFRLNKTA